MAIYKVDLLKRVSISDTCGCYAVSSIGDEYFTVLGHFDYACAKEVHSFSEIVEYRNSIIINNQRFIRHSLFMCEITGSPTNVFSLLDENTQQKNIYMVCALKLNLCPEIYSAYKSVDILFSDIKRSIITALNERYPDIILNVYAGIGSFDIIVVACSADIMKLKDIPSVLRIMPLSSIIPSQENGFLFVSSNSFIVVHPHFNTENAVNRNMNVSIRYSMRNLNSYNQLKSIHADVLDMSESSIAVYTNFGEYDITVFAFECPLKNILKLLGIRNDNPGSIPSDFERKLQESLNAYDQFIKDNILITHTQLLFETDFIPNETESNFRRSLMDEKIRAIENSKKQIMNLTPVSLHRTLDLLVDRCVCMLSEEHRIKNGIRLFHILNDLFNIVKKASKEQILNSDFVNFIGGIGITLNVLMQADNIQLDFFDSDDIETIDPVTKFYFAYENVIRVIYDIVNIRDDDQPPLFMLAINPGETFETTSFLENPNVLYVNLPSVRYYDPRSLMPQLAHEISHQVSTLNDASVRRNKAFYHLFKNYIRQFVWLRMAELSGERMDIIHFNGFMDYFFECFANEQELTFNVKLEDFLSQCESIISRAREQISEICLACDIAEDKQYYKLLAVLIELDKNNSYLKVLADVLREARADEIMCVLCGFTPSRYIRTHMLYVEDNLLKTATDSISYKLRLASVFIVFGDIKETIKTLSAREYDFFSKIADIAASFKLFLSPVTDYLRSIREQVTSHLKQYSHSEPKPCDIQISDVLTLFDNAKEPDEETFDNTIRVLLNEWYHSAKYWGERE